MVLLGRGELDVVVEKETEEVPVEVGGADVLNMVGGQLQVGLRSEYK